MRKKGGEENSFHACSFAASNVDAREGDAGAVMAMTTGIGFAERVEARVMSRSRVVFAVVSRQLSAQHCIDECVAGILLLDFSTQHAAAAGSAVTKSTSATAIADANRFVNVDAGFTMDRTPQAVSVFPRP
jgi:hypothetical protein